MSLDQIRQNLPRNLRRFVSAARPVGGWKDLKHKELSSMARMVTEFEAQHPGAIVWACDFFEADGHQYHLLFYDAGGVLIGFERWGGYAVLSVAISRANEALAPGRPPRLPLGGSEGLGYSFCARSASLAAVGEARRSPIEFA